MMLQKLVQTILHRDSATDHIAVAVSQASEKNKIAANNLDQALRITVDRPENCLAVKRADCP